MILGHCLPMEPNNMFIFLALFLLKVIFYGWHHGIHSSPSISPPFGCSFRISSSPSKFGTPRSRRFSLLYTPIKDTTKGHTTKLQVFPLWKRYERKCGISGCTLGFSFGFACVVVGYLGVHSKKNTGNNLVWNSKKKLQPSRYKKDISYLPYPLDVCWLILSSSVHKCWLIRLVSARLKPEMIRLLGRSFGRIEVIKDGQREKGWVFLGI